MRVLIVALALSLLIGVVPSLAGPSLDTWVAGKSIGRVRVGMPMSDAAVALRAFGEIREVRWERGQRICNLDVGVGFCVRDFVFYGDDEDPIRSPGRVLDIVTDDSRFKSATGVGVGSQKSDFLRLYGPAEYVNDSGWEEWMTKGVGIGHYEGRVLLLVVFRPRP